MVKDRVEYFKPKIHVEYEHPEKSDNVIELFVRGWKIEVDNWNFRFFLENKWCKNFQKIYKNNLKIFSIF